MATPTLSDMPSAILATVAAIEKALDNSRKRSPLGAMFGGLFGNAEDRQKAKLEREIADVRKERLVIEADLATATARIAEMQRELAAAPARIADLNRQIADTEAQTTLAIDTIADMKIAALGIPLNPPFRKHDNE